MVNVVANEHTRVIEKKKEAQCGGVQRRIAY